MSSTNNSLYRFSCRLQQLLLYIDIGCKFSHCLLLVKIGGEDRTTPISDPWYSEGFSQQFLNEENIGLQIHLSSILRFKRRDLFVEVLTQ